MVRLFYLKKELVSCHVFTFGIKNTMFYTSWRNTSYSMCIWIGIFLIREKYQ